MGTSSAQNLLTNLYSFSVDDNASTVAVGYAKMYVFQQR